MQYPVMDFGAVKIRFNTETGAVDLSTDGGGTWIGQGAGGLPDGAVTTAKLSDGAVTVDKCAPEVGTKQFRTSNTFAVSGEIKVPAGNADVVPGFWVELAPGQSAQLVAVRWQIGAGTSVTFSIKRNGADVAGLTGIVATPVGGRTPLAVPLALADGDYMQLVVTAVVGTPYNLSVTLLCDHTQ